MDKIIAMTHQQRERILQTLTVEQINALGEFTRFTMLSRFHNRHYLKQTDWEFLGMLVDPWYQRAHDHQGENLYCDCGRRLKNQFILRSKTTGRRLFLGITHFQQHASIPAKVTREIQAGINEINLYMDGILLAYRAGKKFPLTMFEGVVNHGGFKYREGTILYQRCSLFKRVNLPLHPRDYAELETLYRQVKSESFHRLTKAEINNILKEIASDWRQIDQQIMMFNYLLRQQVLDLRILERIKSNSVNYALQRRKSRFLIHNYKQIMNLTLAKARAQLAIKLRQLGFYIQVLQDLPITRIRCAQAKQIMHAHQVTVANSHYYGIQEAKKLVKKIIFTKK